VTLLNQLQTRAMMHKHRMEQTYLCTGQGEEGL
jgi:hypothetical protein